MGPGDSYLLQYSRNIESFWATPYSLALGATFRAHQDRTLAPLPRQLVTKVNLLFCWPQTGALVLLPALVRHFCVACPNTNSSAHSWCTALHQQGMQAALHGAPVAGAARD